MCNNYLYFIHFLTYFTKFYLTFSENFKPLFQQLSYQSPNIFSIITPYKISSNLASIHTITFLFQRSFRSSVIASISSEKAGPMAITVLEPASIWVQPASSTIQVLMPIYSFQSLFLTLSISQRSLDLTTILAPPEFSQLCRRSLDLQSKRAVYSICWQAPITAWPTWAQILPFPIFKPPLTTNSILALLGLKGLGYSTIPSAIVCWGILQYMLRSVAGPSSIIFIMISPAFSLSKVMLVALRMQNSSNPNSDNSTISCCLFAYSYEFCTGFSLSILCLFLYSHSQIKLYKYICY